MAPKSLRIRDLGYSPGTMPTGPTNSILDVPGVHISQTTVPTTSSLKPGSTATKGVTVISPRPPKEFYKPCAASSFTFNGNGQLTGTMQISDWGWTNTPIAFTNSLSLGTVFDGMWDWIQERQEAMGWDNFTQARHYGTPVVGETADWIINEPRRSRVSKEDIKSCFEGLKSGEDGASVQEGQFGGGAGMTCHQFTGGTGTASRLVGGGEGSKKEYTLGVICQSNYGILPDLVIGGVPVGRILKKEKESESSATSEGGAEIHAPASSKDLAGRTKDGSILVLVITDAPLATHQLNRLARHAAVGLGQVGSHGIGKTFSGDIFLAVSTAENGPQQLEDTKLRSYGPTQTYQAEIVKNESIDSYFYAVAEATEEAILNSMVGGRDGIVTMDGTKFEGMPVEKVKSLLERHMVRV